MGASPIQFAVARQRRQAPRADAWEAVVPQVEAFLSILCEDTEIAELELQMGSFQMKVWPFIS